MTCARRYAVERAVGYGRDAVGSSWRWITASQTWWAGTWRRRAIGGQRSSRSARVYEPTWTATRPIALGLGLRHDWGPQYTAHQFQGELAWLGIRSTASYVGEPECNGVAERFMRTLKEECLYLHDFESLRSMRSSNATRLLERHGYRTPAQVRQELTLNGMIRPPTCPGNRNRYKAS